MYAKGGECVAKIPSNAEKRDVRLQIFVTQSMDDKLDDVAELMGMSKGELCRMAIGNLILGYNKSIDIMKEIGHEEVKKNEREK